jgi:hypothetical protein
MKRLLKRQKMLLSSHDWLTCLSAASTWVCTLPSRYARKHYSGCKCAGSARHFWLRRSVAYQTYIHTYYTTRIHIGTNCSTSKWHGCTIFVLCMEGECIQIHTLHTYIYTPWHLLVWELFEIHLPVPHTCTDVSMCVCHFFSPSFSLSVYKYASRMHSIRSRPRARIAVHTRSTSPVYLYARKMMHANKYAMYVCVCTEDTCMPTNVPCMCVYGRRIHACQQMCHVCVCMYGGYMHANKCAMYVCVCTKDACMPTNVSCMYMYGGYQTSACAVMYSLILMIRHTHTQISHFTYMIETTHMQSHNHWFSWSPIIATDTWSYIHNRNNAYPVDVYDCTYSWQISVYTCTIQPYIWSHILTYVGVPMTQPLQKQQRWTWPEYCMYASMYMCMYIAYPACFACV